MGEPVEVLGYTYATFEKYTFRIELVTRFDKFGLTVQTYSEDGKFSQQPADWWVPIKLHTEYIESSSLLDRALGRAEKRRTGTNATEFIEDILSEITLAMKQRLIIEGREVDKEVIRCELAENIFPVDTWADVEDISVEDPPGDIWDLRGF